MGREAHVQISEGKHFIRSGELTEFKDFTLFHEVKPYRDNAKSR
jgi:hypothetical protein